MDSGNSGGSLQSSSGGEDEFDSRGGVDSSSPLSALLRPSSSAAAAFGLHGSMYGYQELASAASMMAPPSHQHQQHQHQQQQAAPWSAQFTAGAGSSSSPRRVGQQDAMAGGDAHLQADLSGPSTQEAPPPPRGSRKRTRASRRAPTTVLTTDTSNFRAMVQEFTGIPSPPFVAGGGVPGGALRSRFDHLFPSHSTLRSATGAAGDPASSLPPYLLRPFAQKLPTAPPTFPPFTSSSSSTPSTSNVGVTNANATAATTTTTATSRNPTAAGDTFPLTPSALLRMQDPNSYLSFQNFLGSQSSSSQPMFGGFAPGPRLHEASPPEFLPGVGVGSGLTHHGGLMSSEGIHLHHRNDVHHGGDELSGVVASGSGGGGYGGSCKPSYSPHPGASSSPATANADKPPDGNAPAPARPSRGADGLDPAWICTSE